MRVLLYSTYRRTVKNMSTKSMNINIEQFRKLPQVVKGEGKNKIVDWSKVRDAVVGKPFTAAMFEEQVQKLFPEKKAVNYSEMYRVLESWGKHGYLVEQAMTEEKRVVYLVTKVETEQKK